QLRKLYLDYFAERGHKVLPSASLVPKDLTLLFTSAGMVQFKDSFWGQIDPPSPRVATCQKCFRATDIEKVGKTAFHHTFFEMLGNFAFGDYFKEGAIKLAWEFVAKELAIPHERLWVSVYEEDEEAYAIWRDMIGLPTKRIVRLGKEHNWWGPVGKTGPCGPDSEIFYDAGEDKACGPDCRGVACDCNRFSEIWNLVFMQYEAKDDGSFVPLKRKNIDTGMGLERTAAVLQGVESDYEIDLFRPIVEAIEAQMSGKLAPEVVSLRNLIADHIRGLSFLIAAGVLPNKEGRGYVLRRVFRRTIRCADSLGIPPNSLPSLIEPVIQTLGATYPEIEQSRSLVRKVLRAEENLYRQTHELGQAKLLARRELFEEEGCIPGKVMFELYDTHGVPTEAIEEFAAEWGFAVDTEGFQKELEKQRTRSRKATSVSVDVVLVRKGEERASIFLGYEVMEAEGEVRGVYSKNGSIAEIVFDRTPFYAAAGGQIADTGTLENLIQVGRAKVIDVQKNLHGACLHYVEITEGRFAAGDRCHLEVDEARRKRIARNHTATHLLHAALREVLGEHVIQAGSYVSDEELRFDFSHFEKVTPEELARVEDLANTVVMKDLPVKTEKMSLEAAKASGAAAHFDEEYKGKDLVRVVSVGEFSRELCGGTHVMRSGEIGLIKVISEESVAAGTRRIRAVTGDGVLAQFRSQEDLLRQLRAELGEEPLAGLAYLRDEIATLRESSKQMTEETLKRKRDEILAHGEKHGKVTLLSGRLDMRPEEIKHLADLLEEKSPPAVVLLVGNVGVRGIGVCKVSKGLGAVDASALLHTMTESLGGGGGGNRSFAQGGGSQVSKLDEALTSGVAAARATLAD
ncbi:alanine--tRNA ligase, partial [Candidatus Bipolaricaulota bacterium]|nr:alanine--tRNA ligase [Candidatus Bipolaricaulota bacterium]